MANGDLFNSFIGGGARGFYAQPAQSPNILPLSVSFDQVEPGMSIPTEANGNKLSSDERKYYMNEAINARSALDSQNAAMEFNRVEAAKSRD